MNRFYTQLYKRLKEIDKKEREEFIEETLRNNPNLSETQAILKMHLEFDGC